MIINIIFSYMWLIEYCIFSHNQVRLWAAQYLKISKWLSKAHHWIYVIDGHMHVIYGLI